MNDFPQLCTKCQGYKTMPFTFNTSITARMCECANSAPPPWECPRCHKINAPFKDSCNCLPFNPMGDQPSFSKWKKFDTKNYPTSDDM